MSFDPDTLRYSRKYRYETDPATQDKEHIRQSDHDRMVDDVVDGIDEVAAWAHDFVDERFTELVSSALDQAVLDATNLAESWADDAKETLADFEQHYLGPKATAPSTDNEGQPLEVGALYFNTTASEMRVWSGSVWVAAYLPVSGVLEAGNNLSDVASVAEARTNLELGALATLAGATNHVPIFTGPNVAATTPLSSMFIHPGMVAMFAQSAAPTGWLKANGALVSRSTYAELFAEIGTTFGVGNGSTTFALPDLRGEFLRGWDDGRGADPGRIFGSAQDDEFRSHRHNVQIRVGNDGNASHIDGGTSGTTRNYLSDYTGGVETRPRNVALLACIKY